MDIINVVPGFSVAGQIAIADLQSLKDQGFTTVICNRPDTEVELDLIAENFAAEAHRLGITFTYNPLVGGQLTQDHLTRQSDAMNAATGDVFAYCRTGNRSTILWSLVQAGKMPTDDIIAAAANAGFNVENARQLIEQLAGQ